VFDNLINKTMELLTAMVLNCGSSRAVRLYSIFFCGKK
jgi:hypothetical protein